MILGLTVAMLAIFSSSATFAATITHANSSANWNVTSSWVGDTIPGTSDIALFDSTYSSAGTATLGTGAVENCLGLVIANPVYAVNFQNTSASKYLGIGASGVDMSNATQDLTLVNARVNATQSWQIASGRTFTVGSTALTWSSSGLTVNITGGTNGMGGTVALVATGAQAMGGSWTVGGGASLDLEGISRSTFAATISGSGAGGNGAIVNSGASQTQGMLTLTLAGDASIGGINGWNVSGAGAAVNLNGYSLTKTGTNTIEFVGAAVGSGNINVNQGTLAFESGATVTGAGTITVNNGGTLNLAGCCPTVGIVTIAGGAIMGSGTLTGGAYAGQSGTVSAILAGVSAALTKTGTGTLTLSGSNSYGGGTTINAGTLVVANAASLPGYAPPGSVTFAGGTLLANVGAGNNGWPQAQFDNLRTGVGNNAGLAVNITGGNLDYNTGGAVTLASITAGAGGTLRLIQGASNQVTVTSDLSGSNQNGILPWAILKTGSTIDLAVAGPANSPITAYTGYTTDGLTWGAAINARPASTPPAVTVATSANALLLDNGVNFSVGSSAGTLTLGSGGTGLLVQTGGTSTFTVGNVQQNCINFTNGVIDTEGTLIFTANIKSQGFNFTSLAKTGPGTLQFGNSSSGNPCRETVLAAGGTVYLNQGLIDCYQDNALQTSWAYGGAETLCFNGGNLTVHPMASIGDGAFNMSLVFNASADFTLDRTGGTGAGYTTSLGRKTTAPNSVTFGPVNVTIAGGTNVTSGTAGLTLGNTTGTGANASTVTLNGTPTLNIINPTAGGATVLTLNGAVGDGGNGYGIIKTGNGTLVLHNGASTYAGGTTMNAGTLVVANTAGSATGFGSVTLNGGTLAAGAAGGTIVGLVQAGSGQHTIAPGAGLSSGQYGTLNLNGGLTTNQYTTLAFNLGGPVSGGTYSGDLITIGSSSLTVGASTTISFAGNPGSPGDYRLISGSNLSGALISNFLNFPRVSNGNSLSLSTSIESGYLDLVVAAVGSSSGTWANSSGGTWSTPGNWQGSVPASGGTAAFGSVISNPATITLDTSPTLSALVFDNSANGYTIAGSGSNTLMLSNSGSIAVISGTHSISAPIMLAGSLAVSMTSGGVLDLSGSVSESTIGSALSLSGNGDLVLSGTGSYTGGTVVNGGTMYLTSSSGIAAGTSLSVAAGATFIYDPSVVASQLAVPGGRAAAAAAVAAVPEPGTLALLSVALWSAAIYRRFRRRKAGAAI